ncbi:MAG TPA: ATP-binding protein, partial [Jatrophihabitans sp.]|nr:ATP-binding protein [Jatrophihabitans sp.]
SAPQLSDLPNGPGSTLACLVLAALLVEDARGRYVLLVIGPSEHQTGLHVEVAGLPVVTAQAVHAELDDLRSRLNVYRGQLLDVSASPIGITLSFAELPHTARSDVVLPDLVLSRIERHALGVSTHRSALLEAGQHLKRGLLLYGPPGTGKTHTTRYLVGQMTGYTRLMLTGRALHAIGSVAELARELEPAVIVLEDVDLVAEDRGFSHGSSPVLFELLDAMDGAAADADLLFVLTTNRADLLEPALAARPGRVDVAVEIDLPDGPARRRLFDLYARDVPLRLTDAEVEEVVERTEGVTASFLKELIRRAVLESLHEQTPLSTVTGSQTRRALDDLLDSNQQVTRSLLGVGNDPTSLPPGGGLGPPPGLSGRGWLTVGQPHERPYWRR